VRVVHTQGTTLTEEKGWRLAFLVLLVFSLATALLRLTGVPFLILEFELSLIYLPMLLAGAVVVALRRRGVSSS
jgi:hypothetical protein